MSTAKCDPASLEGVAQGVGPRGQGSGLRVECVRSGIKASGIGHEASA